MHRRGGDSKSFTRGRESTRAYGAAREPVLPEPKSPQGVWLGGGTSGGYPHAGALTWAVCLELARKQPSQVRSGAWLRRVAGGNGLETQCAAGKGARHKALTDR